MTTCSKIKFFWRIFSILLLGRNVIKWLILILIIFGQRLWRMRCSKLGVRRLELRMRSDELRMGSDELRMGGRIIELGMCSRHLISLGWIVGSFHTWIWLFLFESVWRIVYNIIIIIRNIS